MLDPSEGYFNRGDYTITFSKPGYSDTTVYFSAYLNGWYLAGNLVFGGLLGWFIVDPATGAMWSLDESASVGLSKIAFLSENSPQQEQRRLGIMTLDEVPDEMLPYLRRIN